MASIVPLNNSLRQSLLYLMLLSQVMQIHGEILLCFGIFALAILIYTILRYFVLILISSLLRIMSYVLFALGLARLPFSSSSIKSTNPFQLIHFDVWGPYTQKTYTSCSCFLTIVDDFTRCTWVFLMKHNSESVSHLTTFLEYV